MRYELKYKIEDLSLNVVLQALRLHPAALRQIYPTRQINNIYFDTPNLMAYQDNVIGVANRKKFRVRWYNNTPNEVVKPLLEIKIKQNQLGTKEIQPIANFSNAADRKQIALLTKQVNQLCGLHTLQPVLLNSYVRSYFGTADRKFRITIDQQLRYFSFFKARHFSSRYHAADNAVVLELKYEKELDEMTDRITQFLPFRQTKSSKYVTGVQLTK
ncbi:MAG: polyphosphate polymerase domain-containing protein [Chitinophagales bacterium]